MKTKRKVYVRVPLTEAEARELRQLAARKTLWESREFNAVRVIRQLVRQELAEPEVAYAGY